MTTPPPNLSPAELRDLARAALAGGDAGLIYLREVSFPNRIIALVDRLEQVIDDRDQISGNPGCYGDNPMTTPLLPESK